jgi:hypothetical protein
VTELPVNEALETTIEEPEGSLEALQTQPAAEVARDHPLCLTAWASLGDAAFDSGDFVSAYAFYRVGYHRGLDRIRQAGWRGKGRVPWSHNGNRGFLRALKGLGRAAGAIGEKEEADRCAEFYAQLAPDAP